MLIIICLRELCSLSALHAPHSFHHLHELFTWRLWAFVGWFSFSNLKLFQTISTGTMLMIQHSLLCYLVIEAEEKTNSLKSNSILMPIFIYLFFGLSFHIVFELTLWLLHHHCVLLQVNLDSTTRDLTIQLLQAPSRSSLSHAQKRIYSLLDTDCYPRFLQSDVYLALLHEAE